MKKTKHKGLAPRAARATARAICRDAGLEGNAKERNARMESALSIRTVESVPRSRGRAREHPSSRLARLALLSKFKGIFDGRAAHARESEDAPHDAWKTRMWSVGETGVWAWDGVSRAQTRRVHGLFSQHVSIVAKSGAGNERRTRVGRRRRAEMYHPQASPRLSLEKLGESRKARGKHERRETRARDCRSPGAIRAYRFSTQVSWSRFHSPMWRVVWKPYGPRESIELSIVQRHTSAMPRSNALEAIM